MRFLTLSFFIISIIITKMTIAQTLDLEKAIPLAEKGVVREQYNLAYSYFHGKNGIPQDKEKAMYWMNKAAKGNSAAVHYKIGRLYETGEIYPQNNKKAFEHESPKQALVLTTLYYCFYRAL